MIYPSFDQIKELLTADLQSGNLKNTKKARDEKRCYHRLPLKLELYADSITPVMAIRRLKRASHHCFLLESAEQSKQWGRYSFLGYDPTMEITCQNRMAKITNRETGTKVTKHTDHSGSLIRKIMEENRAPRLAEMPPFSGGLVGYFSYDYIKYSEPSLKLDAKDEESFQDVDLMLFDKVIAFDNYRQKVILIVNIKTDDLENAYHTGEQELQAMASLLTCAQMADNPPLKLKSRFRYLFD